MANALNFRPAKAQEKRLYGIATVVVKNGSKAKITFKESEDSYTFDMEDMPERPKLLPNTEGVYMVVMAPDKKSVEKLGPSEGHCLAKLVDLSRPEEDADPEPYEVTKQNRDGEEYSYMEFKAFFEVQKGKFRGQVIPHWLRYKFEQDPDEPEYTRWEGSQKNKNAKHLPRLIEWAEHVGCINEPIEWPSDGNVLPELLARALDADLTVDLIIKDGFIDSIIDADYEEEDFDKPAPAKAKKAHEPEDADEFEEAPAPKKAAPKAAAKPTKAKAPAKAAATKASKTAKAKPAARKPKHEEDDL